MRGVAPAVARARSTATGTGCCAAPRTLSLLWVVGELVILFMVFRYRLYGRYLLNEKGRGRSVVVCTFEMALSSSGSHYGRNLSHS